MQRTKYIYLIIIAVCVLIISTSIYYMLGGFDPIKIYFFEGTSKAVIGKEFLIPNDRKIFFKKMDSARMDIQSGKLKGELTAVIYENDYLSEDSIQCFIGASQNAVKNVVRIPAGFKYRQYTTEKVYKIFITQHPLIQPIPGKIEEMMKVRSIQEGEVLQPITFELYYEDGSSSIEKWVK